jgi:predicted nucleotidyltransferase
VCGVRKEGMGITGRAFVEEQSTEDSKIDVVLESETDPCVFERSHKADPISQPLARTQG